MSINRKKLPFIILIIVILVTVPLEVFAWFVIRNNIVTEDANMGIIPDAGEIDVFVYEEDGVEKIREFNFFPGSSVIIQIELINKNAFDVWRTLDISGLDILYYINPDGTKRQSLFLEDKHIFTDSLYYKQNDTLFDFDSLVLPETPASLLNRFIMPSTGAYRYEIYSYPSYDFHEGYTTKRLTQGLPNATQNELESTTYIPLVNSSNPLLLYGSNYGESEESPIIDENGRVFVKRGSSFTSTDKTIVYMLMHFDENFYPELIYNSQALQLKNSNAFMYQSIRVKLNYTDEAIEPEP